MSAYFDNQRLELMARLMDLIERAFALLRMEDERQEMHKSWYAEHLERVQKRKEREQRKKEKELKAKNESD